MSTFLQSKNTSMVDSTPKKENGGKEEDGKEGEKEEEKPPRGGSFVKLFGKKKGEGGSKKESEVEKPGSVSIFKLFSFADPLDVLLMIFGIVGGIGNGLSMPLMTVVFGQTVDALGNSSANPDRVLEEVSKVAVRFVYIGVGAAVTSFMQVTFWMITGERQSSRIRCLYLKAILRQDVAFFDTEGSTGEVVGRMSGDIVVIQEAMGEKVGTFLQLSSTFVGGFIIAFIKGWKLALVMLGTIPLIAIAGGTMAIIIGKMSTRGQDAYAQAGDIVEQTIGAIRTVLSFTGERKAVQDYKLALNKAYKTSIQQGLASGLGIGFALLVMFCSYGLALWYGSKLIINENYTGGRVWNVIFAVLAGGMSLGQAAPSVSAFAAGKAAAYKMFEVIKRVPDIDVYNQKGKILDTIKGDIEFRNVKFSYPTRPDVHVFTEFCLEIPSSTTTALVGESGSGKSTVISLIERFYDPQGGMVMLDGIDLKEVQLRSLRQHIGLVSQEPVLFGTSILENIAYGKDGATRKEIEAAAKVANAANFINQMPKGYDTMVGEHGSHLSGGQKQRVAIARAILKNPRILLLDEATSALDAESEHLVQEALEKVMIGRTTVVVAHRLTTIKNADAIAVVHRGIIVEKGSHENLIQNTEGAYFQLIKLQQVHHGNEEEGQEGADWNQYIEKPSSVIEQGSFRISSNMGGSRRSISSISQTVEIKEKKGGFLGWLKTKKSKKTEDAEGGKRKSHANVSLTRLAALNKPEIPIFMVGTVGAIAHGMIFPVFGLLISSILSTFYKPHDELRKGANFWALMFVVLAIGGFIVLPTQLFCFSVGGSKLVRRIRILAFEKVVRQEISWFDETENSSGAISARLSTDAAQVKSLVGDALAVLMQNLATIVASLGIAFAASWELALVIIAVVPLLGLQGMIQMKLLKGFSADAKVMYEEASQVANDAVSSIRTVASFCAEDKVLDLYKQKCQTPIHSGIRNGLLSGFGIGIANFVMFSTNGFCFWFGSKLVKNGRITFEDVFRVFFAVTIGAFGISQSISLFPDVAKVKIAVNSIFSVLDRKSQIDPYDGSGATLPSVIGNIEFKKVNFKYPTRPDVHIFQSLCLSIPAGKTVALVGESGSGKSTSISLLQRFYDPDSGAILLDGSDIKRLQVKWLRQQMGLVSQEPILFNDSIQANIAYGKDEVISSTEIIAAAEASNAHNFISSLPDGYNTRVGERGIQLSGGQKQRVAIARAIVKNPKILLLDEATSALDAESEHVVQDALEKVMMGKSTLVIAHRLSTIRNVDIIAVLKNGVIVERGKHEELMSIPDGAYASLVKLHTNKQA